MKQKFVGTIEDGSFWPDDKDAWSQYTKMHANERVVVSVGKPSSSRSSNQNRYYWGVVLTMIAAETGHTPEEIHDSEPLQKLRRIHDDKLGFIVKSTTDMTTAEFEDYLSRTREFASSFFGLFVPLPNEAEP